MDQALTVLVVGIEQALADELADDERYDVRSTRSVDEIDPDVEAHAVVVAVDAGGPLELLDSLRSKAPEAAVLVVTDGDREADGAVALHAGAEDHLDSQRRGRWWR
jgi:DNA-binding NarL/FixJ family response regulator